MTRVPNTPLPSPEQPDRRPWQPPVLSRRGTLGALLEGGRHKVSVTTGDPGESRKYPGSGYEH